MRLSARVVFFAKSSYPKIQYCLPGIGFGGRARDRLELLRRWNHGQQFWRGTSWSGTMAVGGTVSVTFNGASQASTGVTVQNRTGFAFSAVSATPQSSGFKCGGGIFPGLGCRAYGWRQPIIGLHCMNQTLSFIVSTISGGPNHGFNYVTSISNSRGSAATNFNWDNGSNGFIGGANLRANTIRHESDSASQSIAGSASNNLGTVAEQQAAAGSQSTFIRNVESTLKGRVSTITSAAAVEPFGVNGNASGAYQGPINSHTYQSCN